MFGGPVPEQGIGAQALDAIPDVFAHSRPPSPRFFGYVLGSGDPVAATGDFIASVLNQNVTAWRSGPAAISIERTVIRWIAEAMGCGGFTGSLTGGGSSANLMGLAMAREAKMPSNEEGAKPAVVYASTEVHMSIPKAVALLGLGRNHVRYIPVLSDFRMDVDALKKAVEEDRKTGKRAIAVVANGGTVNAGSIDDLQAIAKVTHENGLWFHIDGAYGLLAALAAPEKFRGIELADSFSLDPHKWLYQPLDCGMLLYRDSEIARKTFAYSGDYTKVLNTEPLEGYAFFEESIELSRRFRALKLWLSLRYHGLAAFRKAIQKDLDHAQMLAGLVDDEPRLERMASVTLSAVCFRWKNASDDFNQKLMKRIVHRGRVFLSNATINGQFALRCCFVNHRTTEADVRAIIEETVAAANDLLTSDRT
ncbi:MAG TPA: pyridoxal-dependent decarboxylase [Terriglobales bacterium]|nr:pyridoxal-dependent decarboxylase [Terriglobales bacterium]